MRGAAGQAMRRERRAAASARRLAAARADCASPDASREAAALPEQGFDRTHPLRVHIRLDPIRQ
jgi:hypothetical protein